MNKPFTPPKVTELKIIKVGNSAAVLLPKEVLARLRAAVGDKLCLGENSDGYAISVKDQNFIAAMAAAEEIMREDRDILAVLAT